MVWERYRGIIGDWEKFWEFARRPQPRTLRIQTGRIPPDRVVERLEAQGFRLEPLPFPPHFYRIVHEPFPISKTLEHWLGFFYVQESVMGLVAWALLGPTRPQSILDLCAAPGGKTTHLADILQEGTVIASDISARRIRALASNVLRTGCLNVMIVQSDGRLFPQGALFDVVLVDAPCSAEGNLRNDPAVLREPSRGYRRQVTNLQEALLRRAVSLVRPGGTILYVTCTFAPEENEAIVDRILREAPELDIEPIDLPIPHEPGLLEFLDMSFDRRLREAWRVYPYHMDSGGLFMVRLKKTGRPQTDVPLPEPPLVFPGATLREEEAQKKMKMAISSLQEEFAVDGRILENLRWLVAGRTIWVHRCEAWPVALWKPGGAWKLVSCGIRAFSEWKGGYRPTSWFLQWLGPHLKARKLFLEEVEWVRLLAGQFVEARGLENGFVALGFEGCVVGLGIARGGRIRHMLPVERAAQLQEILALRSHRRSPSEIL
ncbi:MAG: RsmB/NOP family class I SAM-dependent RNA methyltransferase [Armatimonadota bacterium]|nr:RsmB/NOP family class I SAM-dependent RNA methyltransferase [Armatimonadota bacterium]MDR5703099.1 RsmB/NOP family class I SAM-dependent RNA methyltransferase [Armatimonadota bacterium]MDR7434974.1 RsmB/NOP family class I SAM-dependent RNA methyltransferase [Armatimonadota bacterium]